MGKRFYSIVKTILLKGDLFDLIWSRLTKITLLVSLHWEIDNDSIWIEIYFWFSNCVMSV